MTTTPPNTPLSAERYEQEKRCCTVCDAKKVCTICGTATLYACSDCRIDFQTTIYVCPSTACRDRHEEKCSARLREELDRLRATPQPAPADEKCNQPAASFIPRWGMSFACVLPKGHEGEHKPGGNCFQHGEYVGRPGECPECYKVSQQQPAPTDTRALADRPRIVCLCGSTRFKQAFEEANWNETLGGNIVLSVGCFMHADSKPITMPQKFALDELHKRKIDLADEVLVLNVGGYIGQSTRSEIEYAEAHGKPVRYLEAI